MPQDDTNQIFPIFFGVWIVLGLVSGGFFIVSKNAPLKRKVWPPFTIATGLLFIGFSLAMGLPAQMLYVVVPGVALVTVLNLRAAQFCNSCGATIMSGNLASKPAFCSKCGAKLDR
jgi:hypothetical protein